MLRSLSFCIGLAAVEGTIVGVLSGHDPAAWSNSSCKDAGSLGMIQCNLRVAEAAAAMAASAGVELLVLPEGYAFSGSPVETGFFDAHVAETGGTPCLDLEEATAPQQKAVSCMARSNGVAIAANIFTELANHSRRMTEIVFDGQGAVVAMHDKMHLCPIYETGVFEAGPFEAPTFDLLGQRWGMLICYEGIYPWTLGLGDFSQHQGMVDQGATAFLWSIGAMVPPWHYSKDIAKKFNVAVVASENDSPVSHVGAIVDANGENLATTDLRLDLGGIGYTAQAVVNYAELPVLAAV